jgi:hypothetical protein
MFERMSLGVYAEAAQRGMSLTAFLAREMTEADKREGLDGYERLLAVSGIVTRTHPTGSYQASEMSEWEKAPQKRALFPEWVRRTAERARHHARAVYLSSDAAGGSVLNPYDDLQEPRVDDRTEPAIPLEETIAGTRFVGSDRARSLYLTRSATDTRKKRVAEAADIPRSKILTGQHDIPLYKYGIALEASYESMRRVRIDQFARFLQMEAIQAVIDKVATVIDVMVNGDGNSGTAATSYNLTTLDSAAVAGTLTLKGWLSFKAKFQNPYMLTHALAPEAMVLQLLLLNIGSANWPLNQRPDLGGFTPINQTFADGVRWGITSDAPTGKIIGYDRRFAIGRVVETGSEIMEMDRWITRQVEVLTATETEGYETIDANAVKILVVTS